MTAAPGADERRIRHLLRTRGLAYTPGAPMPDKPITPTRVYPANTPLPPRPPEPGEVPPWWTPPPPPTAAPAQPPAPAPAAPPEVIHVIHKVVLEPPTPEPDPTWWDRALALARRIGRPWQIAAALGAAVFPMPPDRYSLATTWTYVVHQTRVQHGMGWGYALGVGVLAATGALLSRRGTLTRLTLLATALIGVLGAVDLYDPITALTGVHHR